MNGPFSVKVPDAPIIFGPNVQRWVLNPDKLLGAVFLDLIVADGATEPGRVTECKLSESHRVVVFHCEAERDAWRVALQTFGPQLRLTRLEAA